MIPDGEKIIGAYLRTNSDITGFASGSGARVVGKTPDSKAAPWIRLTQIDAYNDANVTPDYLITYFLQLDCYAGDSGGQPEAQQLGRVARAVLAGLDGANQTLGDSIGGTAVISRVRFTNMMRLPDDQGFEPARERIILDTLVTMHGVG